MNASLKGLGEFPKLKPFAFHGVEFPTLVPDGKEMHGYCPFCHNITKGAKERGSTLPKFFVNFDTGQYSCKHCTESGNTYVFLANLYKKAFAETTTDDYKALASTREPITAAYFKSAGLALHNGKRWLIPQYNNRGSLVNLRVYDAHHGGPTMATAGLPLHLGGLGNLNAQGPVYLCEGEWDAYALDELRQKIKARGSVLYVPGAGTFKQEWVTHFVNREVIICFDNDGSGYENAKRDSFLLQGKAQSVRMIHWPASCADGYDVRDFVNDAKKQKVSPKLAWENLHKLMFAPPSGGTGVASSPEKTEEAKPLYNLKRTAFKEIVKDFKKYYHFTKESEDTLAIILATTFSSQLRGDPLWIFIVGPAGTGKTLFLRSLENSPFAIFRSSVTAKSFISGYMGGEGDPSLIPQLTGKAFVLKDYTEIITMGQQEQDEIYGILRGAYDGRCEKTFGNGIYRCYEDCYFALIAGVTDVIHSNDRAALGERFLKFQMLDGAGYDPSAHIRAAITGMAKQTEAEQFLRAAIQAFTDRQIEESDMPKMKDAMIERVIALSQIAAFIRAAVPRTRDDIAYRPSPEVGSRLGKQLVKMAQCLSLVYGEKIISPKTYTLIEKVAFDTVKGWMLDLVRLLATPRNRGVDGGKNSTLRKPKTEKMPKHYSAQLTYSFAEIMELAKIPKTSLERKLENAVLLGIVDKFRMEPTDRGQPGFGYMLTEHFLDLWKQAKVGKE